IRPRDPVVRAIIARLPPPSTREPVMQPTLRPPARRRTSAVFPALLALVLLVGSVVAASALPAGAARSGVRPAARNSANAALTRTATTSSTENAGTPASAAVDGNAGTRWSSGFSDPQWLQVDLGSSQAICQVGLTWEAAYAKSFQIQVSDSGTGGW